MTATSRDVSHQPDSVAFPSRVEAASKLCLETQAMPATDVSHAERPCLTVFERGRALSGLSCGASLRCGLSGQSITAGTGSVVYASDPESATAEHDVQ
jgi:hypothetical protein